MKIKIHLIKLLLLAVTMFALPQSAKADGSKDLYPSGKTGVRAYLRSSTTANTNYPFANKGTHYVYAKAGEKILLASSTQGYGSGNANQTRNQRYENRNNIALYGPDGTQITLNVGATSNATGNDVLGNIGSRAQELAGPSLNGSGTLGTTGTYKPIEYTVTVAGIYRVEFTALANGNPSTTVQANANWTQANNNAGIMAWEVSVVANNAFVKGRVYTTVLNLSNGTTNPNSQGFDGIIYALTKDGYTYKVNNNGNNGMYFTFMVNNNGFINSNGEPIYKSLNTTTLNDSQIHNPNNADTNKQVTQKMFYTLPASDLPVSASIAYPSQANTTTWLKNHVTAPEVTNVELVGVEGTVGQVGSKGGYVTFNAATQGNYTIVIESDDTPIVFSTRTLIGSAVAGINEILWDGNDGTGNPIPVGNIPIKVTVQLQGAEVHFPFFDMEYNTNGFILELLDHEKLDLEIPEIVSISDIVYWNDTDIPLGTSPNSGTEAYRRRSEPLNNSHLSTALGGINSTGISSIANGHIWGQGATGVSGQFGDNRSIDTWTFIKGEIVTKTTTVTVKEANLEVVSVTPDKTTLPVGGNITYTVVVKNDGPDEADGAVFTFKIPEGFDPVNIVFTGNDCGEETIELVYDAATRTYTSELKLPNQCVITYEITVKATHPTPGDAEVVAAILRPNDVIDPDATNTDPTVPRGTAEEECENNGLGGDCNNIKTNTITVIEQLDCYKEPKIVVNGGLKTKVGISSLRMTESTEWPSARQGAWIALEAKTKGFVPNRLTQAQVDAIPAANLVKGMMVYNSTEDCLQINVDGTATGWNCFNVQSCE